MIEIKQRRPQVLAIVSLGKPGARTGHAAGFLAEFAEVDDDQVGIVGSVYIREYMVLGNHNGVDMAGGEVRLALVANALGKPAYHFRGQLHVASFNEVRSNPSCRRLEF